MKFNEFQSEKLHTTLLFSALFYEAWRYVCSKFKMERQFTRVVPGCLNFKLDLYKQATYIYLIPKQLAVKTTRRDSLIRFLRGTS